MGRAILRLPAGRHTLHVTGGGRDTTREFDLKSGRRYWASERVPEAHVVLFGRDKTRPDPAGRVLLDTLAEHVGLYDFAIVPYLPMEGSESFDAKLATERARSIYEGLVAAGLSEARLEIREPAAPFDGEASERRRVEIIPIGPGGPSGAQ